MGLKIKKCMAPSAGGAKAHGRACCVGTGRDVRAWPCPFLPPSAPCPTPAPHLAQEISAARAHFHAGQDNKAVARVQRLVKQDLQARKDMPPKSE